MNRSFLRSLVLALSVAVVASGRAQTGPSMPEARTAADDTYATPEDVVLTELAPGGRGNDSDVDGDPLTAVLNTGPGNGTVVLNANGSFDYTPNAGFNGSDSFTYVANDGFIDSAIVTVTLTVNPIQDLPTATADACSDSSSHACAHACAHVCAYAGGIIKYYIISIMTDKKY